MNFALTEEQRAIEDGVSQILSVFDDEYWLEKDRKGGFPEEFYRAMANGGWLGVSFPEEVGGANLGVVSATVMMRAIASSAGAMQAASAIHMNVFGPKAIAVFGTDEQKQRWLPGLIDGTYKMCFAVTEPDAGLDTTRIKTRAERDGDDYIIHGQKIWTSTAQVTEKIMLLARTAQRDDDAPSSGLSLFFTDLDRDAASVREIDKMGRKAVDSNEIFFDGMRVSAADRIGEEGKGFRYILSGMNAERILIAAECIGDARWFIEKARDYANDRQVFGREIGKNQGIQFPIAEAYMQTEAANLMVEEAARKYESGERAGAEANMAKYLASEASWKAADMCMQTHGGFAFAEEYDVERKFRETRLYRIAPVSNNLVLSFVGEHVLGMPKSY